MIRRRPERRTAIHEAGHATLALAVGYEFERIVTEENREDTNATIPIVFVRGEDEVLRVLLAGIMAVRLTGTRWSQKLFRTAREDLEKVGDLLTVNDWPDEKLRRNVNATFATLSQHWRTVEAIADHFQEKGEVSYDDAKNIWDMHATSLDSKAIPKQVRVPAWERLIEKVLSVKRIQLALRLCNFSK